MFEDTGKKGANASDPYCLVFWQGHQVHKTAVVSNDNDAILNDRVVLPSFDPKQTNDLRIEVWDYDAGVNAADDPDEFLGQVEIRCIGDRDFPRSSESFELQCSKSQSKKYVGGSLIMGNFMIQKSTQAKERESSCIDNVAQAAHELALMQSLTEQKRAELQAQLDAVSIAQSRSAEQAERAGREKQDCVRAVHRLQNEQAEANDARLAVGVPTPGKPTPIEQQLRSRQLRCTCMVAIGFRVSRIFKRMCAECMCCPDHSPRPSAPTRSTAIQPVLPSTTS